MKKIIGLGNALTDILLQIDNDEILTTLNLKKGSMQLVDEQKIMEISAKLQNFPRKMVTGGSASNAINGIAKLEGNVGFLGKTGKDEVGQFFEQDMLANGVKPHLLKSEMPSGRCIVLISPDSERTMCTFLGAAASLEPAEITPDVFRDYDVLHVEGYLVQNHELIRKAVASAAEMGLIVSIDLASFNVVEENLDFLYEIVEKHVNIVFANEDEAFSFTGLQPQNALVKIAQLTDIAIVKLGKDGSLIRSGDENYRIAPFAATCTDTTGAGDLYASGFLYGLSNRCGLDVCGKFGSLISSKVVEVVGAKMDNSIWNEIKMCIENQK